MTIELKASICLSSTFFFFSLSKSHYDLIGQLISCHFINHFPLPWGHIENVNMVPTLPDPTWFMAPVPVLILTQQSLLYLLQCGMILICSSSLSLNGTSWEKDSLIPQSKLGPPSFSISLGSFILFLKLCNYTFTYAFNCVSPPDRKLPEEKEAVYQVLHWVRGVCRPVTDVY